MPAPMMAMWRTGAGGLEGAGFLVMAFLCWLLALLLSMYSKRRISLPLKKRVASFGIFQLL